VITALQVAQQSRMRPQRRSSFTQWLLPYENATAGGESAMLRFLDDPDVPCYAEGWLKADKNRFHQARAPGSAKKYVFNPNSWVWAFRDSLTAVSVANEWTYPGNTVVNQGWGSKRGVTLVTPQHVLCSHGGLGIGTEAFPTRFRFVGTDGEAYDRIVVGQRKCDPYTAVFINGADYKRDSNIMTLDTPLPPSVIPVRCIPNSYKFTPSYGQWQGLFVSQSTELDSPSPGVYGEQMNYSPWNNLAYSPPQFPRRHRSMCCYAWSDNPKVGYQCWGGDSGMPLFYGVGTELLFAGFAAGGGTGPTGYPVIHNGSELTWESLTDKMIELSDADAISRGKLTAPTGYTIGVANDVVAILPP
jgi:hypothetical protein